MRGCCHRPGVDGAGEGCCLSCCWVVGVAVLGVDCCVCGAELGLFEAVTEVEADDIDFV